MTNHLNQTDSTEWNQLLESTFDHPIHPGRQKGFCFARQALREALLECGSELPISSLRLKAHHSVENYPQHTLSLSHSSEWGAAVVGNTQEFVSVGIDIERQDRPMKDEILKRVSHSQDIEQKPIERWCLKEAALKALMNTGHIEKLQEFSHLIIGNEVWQHEGSNFHGKWKLTTFEQHVVALAWIPRA